VCGSAWPTAAIIYAVVAAGSRQAPLSPTSFTATIRRRLMHQGEAAIISQYTGTLPDTLEWTHITHSGTHASAHARMPPGEV